MNETARQCKHLGGVAPLGYDVGEDRKLVINEREAETVRMIFGLYDMGHGYQYIINMLNENNYLTKLGRPFGKNSIYTILMNEKYSGVYVFNKSESKDFANQRNTHAYKQDEHIIRIPGGCPKIVERDLFERTQQKMLDNKHHAGRYKAKESYMLSGKVRCGICSKMLYGNNRFSRNPYDSAMYKRELSKSGIKVYSVLERLDDSPESIMMESLLEGMSEYYSKLVDGYLKALYMLSSDFGIIVYIRKSIAIKKIVL